ncbi:uncharacterized protein [Venturia canescens]|uniref:uncharacterized protein isoform X1 n=1 Tax=Venturia canescens TaxID=32260 RepID=UPI001C9C8444|nr:uncharacterized protein LOC122419446 isoform X1 [Venturia canescens]
MKLFFIGVCFALCVCLQAKEVRQISRLIPLEDWIDFKNRTREVKPLDKLIGKLRATYDFVFHKPDDVSNVGKIIKETNESSSEPVPKINSNISVIARRKSIEVEVTNEMDDGKDYEGSDSPDSMKYSKKNVSTGSSDEKLEKGFERLERLENLNDKFTLEHLEILDDENLSDSFDEEPQNTDKKASPPHSKFALPYAIAQAFLRWIISLYLSTSNHFSNIDMGTRESA